MHRFAKIEAFRKSKYPIVPSGTNSFKFDSSSNLKILIMKFLFKDQVQGAGKMTTSTLILGKWARHQRLNTNVLDSTAMKTQVSVRSRPRLQNERRDLGPVYISVKHLQHGPSSAMTPTNSGETWTKPKIYPEHRFISSPQSRRRRTLTRMSAFHRFQPSQGDVECFLSMGSFTRHSWRFFSFVSPPEWLLHRSIWTMCSSRPAISHLLLIILLWLSLLQLLLRITLKEHPCE